MNQFKMKLTDEMLQKVIGAVTEKTGNIVGQKQMNMIESRLTKRAMSLGISSEAEYLEHFNKNRNSELEDLISILTVHHTYFFRESSQFDFLAASVLPPLVKKLKAEGRNKIQVWSAACSRGQEVYSLFMFIDQYLKSNAPEIAVEVLGTDIDRESVKIAANGVYAWDEVKEIPMAYLSKYWTRGTGDIAKFAKVRNEAKIACKFQYCNLMEPTSFNTFGKFDIIFCRNVFIYFQASDIARISDGLSSQLKPDGYFFVGLSESLGKAPKGLKKRGPAVYGPELVEVKTNATSELPKVQGPIRVFCVDDSNTILKLLKSILTKEQGFEIVGTASDGSDACRQVEAGLKFDVMTLDVHMPHMNGVEYLEKMRSTNHPPIVMLTSASRENMDLAYKAIELGAKDYIEKPSLSDLATRSDEIRSKLKSITSAQAKSANSKETLKFEKQFKNQLGLQKLDNKINIIFVDDRNQNQLFSVLKDSSFTQVPCVVVTFSEGTYCDRLIELAKRDSSLTAKVAKLENAKIDKKIYFCAYADFLKFASSMVASKYICYSFLTNIARSQWENCPRSKAMKILITEEVDRSVFLNILSLVTITPSTSFAYMSSEFFGQVDLKIAS